MTFQNLEKVKRKQKNKNIEIKAYKHLLELTDTRFEHAKLIFFQTTAIEYKL